MYDNDTIEVSGLTFRVNFEYDAGRPWENSDGHGPVREASHGYDGHIIKRPGERVLYAGGRNEYSWVYDWQEACKLARKDGWNAEPYDAPGRIERAVQADFDYLRQWCTEQWQYVCVVVTHICKDDDGDYVEGETDSLCGVESYKDYHQTVALELVQGLADGILKERDSVQKWNERDVATV